MITIIHGEDIVSSRIYFIDERKKSSRPIMFSGDNLNLTALTQGLESNSLFDVTDKEIFIEDFFKKNKDKEFKNIVSYLQKQSKNLNLTIWEAKSLSKSQLNIFKNPVIKSFALPKSLFLFLDELKPKNSKRLISLFHKTMETTEEELTFYMMIRQFRLLLGLSKCHPERSEGSRDSSAAPQNDIGNIDEVARLAPWQKAKLQKQASLFSILHLKNIYKKICDIDIRQKTGASALSLPQAIDFLLLAI